jgi:hypothetical protein
MQNNSDINKFLSELGIKDEINIEQNLGDGFVKLKVSEAERRQALQDIKCVEDIVIELLRNSRDASSSNIFIGTKKIGSKNRLIYYIDDGIGIPLKLHGSIFEARVTSKLESAIKDEYGFHGRGMALFSMKLNTEEIKLNFSDTNRGSSFFVNIDLEKLPEKKDQTIFPKIVKFDNNLNIIGGVSNIPKTIIEFKLQNPLINIFYGSPSQVIFTMRKIAKISSAYKNLPKFNNFDEVSDYVKSNKDLKIIFFPSLTENYMILSKIVKEYFNLEISDRNVQRIIYEEFNELKPIDVLALSYENYDGDKNFLDNLDDNENNEKKLKENKKFMSMYDKQKLALRFKDDEINYIIKELKSQINKEGMKYLIKIKEPVDFAKSNNFLKINIEFEEIE